MWLLWWLTAPIRWFAIGARRWGRWGPGPWGPNRFYGPGGYGRGYGPRYGGPRGYGRGGWER
jgi:hypothetical protein